MQLVLMGQCVKFFLGRSVSEIQFACCCDVEQARSKLVTFD